MLYILCGSHLLFDRSPHVHVYVFRYQTFMLPLVHLSLEYNLCLIQHLLVFLQGSLDLVSSCRHPRIITFGGKIVDMMFIKFVLCVVIDFHGFQPSCQQLESPHLFCL